MRNKLLIIGILLLALFLRLYGLNWDQNQHLHPDERFLTMVTTAAAIPSSLSNYLDPTVSKLNPYNLNFNFYVYGTLPVTLVKVAAVTFGLDSYDGITLLGRMMSAMADIGTMVLIFLIAQQWEKREKISPTVKYWAAFLYAIAVLPIQQSHFYTVDTFATFFAFGAVFAAIQYRNKVHIVYSLLSAIFCGLALASKISSLFVLPLVGYFLIRTFRKKNIMQFLLHGVVYALTTYVSLRFADPRVFAHMSFLDPTVNPHFIDNIAELKRLASPNTLFPPTVQWLSKTHIIFPLINMVVFGLGIPYFLLFIAGFSKNLQKRKSDYIFVLIWMVGFFVYQGMQTSMSMRYFYVLYPWIALFAGMGFVALGKSSPLARNIFIILILIWPLAFMHIYTQPHSRVMTSEWIYEHLPKGSKILTEHWDDSLPLSLAAKIGSPAHFSSDYEFIEQRVFDEDTPEKQQLIEAHLRQADYYIMTSNRGYGSIMALPKRYPYMTRIYKDLFAEKLGYIKIADITSFPTLDFGFIQIPIDDQWSEEAFTVYDHPRVLIYKRVK